METSKWHPKCRMIQAYHQQKWEFLFFKPGKDGIITNKQLHSFKETKEDDVVRSRQALLPNSTDLEPYHPRVLAANSPRQHNSSPCFKPENHRLITWYNLPKEFLHEYDNSVLNMGILSPNR